MARLEDYDVTTSFEAVVLDSTRMTPEDYDETRHITLAVPRPASEFELGLSLGLLAPGPKEYGDRKHFRLYSVAGIGEGDDGNSCTIAICVKRCNYIDEYSGEQYKGVASNYFWDLKPGDTITLTGPYGRAFELPEDTTSNLLLVGLGTGIAPFRAVIKHLYDREVKWQGKVRLFYGARSGLELLYLNDQKDDLRQYYDEDTFKAFEAVSPRPYMDDPVALENTLDANSEEVWEMVRDSDTYVYVSGLEQVSEMLDKALAKMAGSEDKWRRKKAEMVAGERWVELIY